MRTSPLVILSILAFVILRTTVVCGQNGSPRIIAHHPQQKIFPSSTTVRGSDTLQHSKNGSVKTSSSVDAEFEFGSLIVDETQTKIGHDFFELFYQNWGSPEEIRNSTVIISEKTLPRLGTQITVRVNDAEVFQNFIQPRYDTIEEMALYAVDVILDYLTNYELIQKELQSGDMQGSGIF